MEHDEVVIPTKKEIQFDPTRALLKGGAKRS